MRMNQFYVAVRATALGAALVFCGSVMADADHDGDSGPSPLGHAPISVMGEHLHKKGEWMVSYRYMHMDMAGNRSGTDSISPDEIATTVPNRFFGRPGQPPTLRVVPTDMTMDMHMFGLMYAPSDQVTLMFMGNYIEKEMDHITFAGGMGTNRLGTFTTKSSGFGDTSASALIRLWTEGRHVVHATAGVSAPTGSNTERDRILTPMGMTPSPRLPYPMQLGSGSWSSIIGLTHNWYGDRWSYGSQWRSLIRLHENDEDYTLGDEHRLTTWAAYRLAPRVSASLRLEGLRRGNIDGIDPNIVAPVQTADPNNQGIKRLDVGLGLNFAASGSLAGHRLAVEWLTPVYQDLDGPQLETDWILTLGWQYAF
ncbi:MAG: transporter [Wenzhouxiangellaceae bacterium]